VAEVEFAGLKFKGGKIFIILTALGTLMGGAWGVFEFYKDYLNMKDTISSYVAPDLSGFDKRLDLVQQEVEMMQSEMSMILEEVGLVADVAKELKNDLKADVRRIETIVEDVETRVKEDSRDNERELKSTVDGIEADMNKLEKELEEAMKELQESIDKQIKLTLENPLNQMKQ
jgi:signal transduction histidine kinase